LFLFVTAERGLRGVIVDDVWSFFGTELGSGVCLPAIPPWVKGRSVLLIRYFLVVGGLLLTLLFIADWYTPSPPQIPTHEGSTDRTILRIRSARKWPEKVQIDTTIPMTAPSTASVVDANKPEQPKLAAYAQAKPAEPQSEKRKAAAHVRRSKPRAAPPMRFAVTPMPQAWSLSW